MIRRTVGILLLISFASGCSTKAGPQELTRAASRNAQVSPLATLAPGESRPDPVQRSKANPSKQMTSGDRETPVWVQDCWDRMDKASSREEKERIYQRCREEHSSDVPFLERPEVEEIGWSEALQWWPYDPVLRLADVDTRQTAERTFSINSKAGTRSDPRKDTSQLVVLYPPASASPDRVPLLDVIQAGGIAITHWAYPPRKLNPPITDLNAKPIRVRGQEAHLIEIYRDISKEETRRDKWKGQGNVDLRFISWSEVLPNGTLLEWRVETHSRMLTEAQAIAILERAVQVR